TYRGGREIMDRILMDNNSGKTSKDVLDSSTGGKEEIARILEAAKDVPHTTCLTPEVIISAMGPDHKAVVETHLTTMLKSGEIPQTKSMAWCTTQSSPDRRSRDSYKKSLQLRTIQFPQ